VIKNSEIRNFKQPLKKMLKGKNSRKKKKSWENNSLKIRWRRSKKIGRRSWIKKYSMRRKKKWRQNYAKKVKIKSVRSPDKHNSNKMLKSKQNVK
jgi:hypothetical protein